MPNYYDDRILRRELSELSFNSAGVFNKEGAWNNASNSRIIVIGLGGMGLKTVARLKAELNIRVGKIDPACLRIIAFDTDKNATTPLTDPETGCFSENEIVLLDNTDVATQINGSDDLRPATINSIIPRGFNHTADGHGSGQVRLMGRACVMNTDIFGKIYDTIKSNISDLQDFTGTTLDIHVVAGVGGGTGSGLIIDVPYIARRAATDAGLTSSRIRIFGHVYLPNTYRANPGFNANSAKRNGYAALKEIDYLMNIKNSGEKFEALYPAPVGQVSYPDPIFNRCTLIGGKLAGGMVIVDSEQKALEACVENLSTLCTNVTGVVADDGREGTITDFYSAKSFDDNTSNSLNGLVLDPALHFPKDGNYMYNIIGASSVKFPTKAISESIIGSVGKQAFELLKANAETLKSEHIDKFERRVGSNPYDIIEKEYEKLERKFDEYLNSGNTVFKKDTVKDGTFDNVLKGYITNAITAFEQNNGQLFVSNIVTAANTASKEIIRDPNKGALYLSKLLQTESNSSGLNGFYQRIRGYDSVISTIKTSSEEAIKNHRKILNDVIKNMQSFGGVGRHKSAYIAALKACYKEEFSVKMCESIRRLLEMRPEGYATHLKKVLDKSFVRAIEIYEGISNVLINNVEIAKSYIDPDFAAQTDPSSVFALTGDTFQKLKTKVASKVGDTLRSLSDNVIPDFATTLVEKIVENANGNWEPLDSNIYRIGDSKMVKEFRDFINDNNELNSIADKKMVDFFDDAHNGDSDAVKTNIVNQLIRHLEGNSAPTTSVWPVPSFDLHSVDTLRYQYMVLPDGFNDPNCNLGTIFKNQYRVTANFTNNIYYSKDQNSIYSYTLYARMPIWIHNDIIEYEKEYNRSTTAGVHINENLSFDPAWRDYPALMPPSQYLRTPVDGNPEYRNDSELQIFKDVRELVEFSKKHGIIITDTNGTRIRFIDNKPEDNAINDFVTDYIDDNRNTDENDNIIMDSLFNAVIEEFGYTETELFVRGNIPNASDELIVSVIRNYMQTWKKLQDEVDYYKKNFVNAVENVINGRRQQKELDDFTRFMLFGLVYCRDNIWYYNLSGEEYEITTEFEISLNDSELGGYMEMAVYDIFPTLRKYPEHKLLLQNAYIEIAKRAGHPGVEKDEVCERANAILSRCKTVLDSFDLKRRRGSTLTRKELKYEEFYSRVSAYIIASVPGVTVK